MKSHFISTGLLVAAFCLMVGACATEVEPDSQVLPLSESRSYTKEELRSNEEAREVFEWLFGLYRDEGLERYVRSVGMRVGARAPLDFEFFILDTDYVNAFAVSGGHIYITRGLLAYLHSEDELAAVIAHEIAHIMEKHSARKEERAKSALRLSKMIMAQTKNSNAREIASTFGVAIAQGYSREQELVADRLSVKYLQESGYNPSGMASVLTLFKSLRELENNMAERDGRKPEFSDSVFASHPGIEQRLIAVAGLRQSSHREVRVALTASEYFQVIEDMVFGNDAEKSRFLPAGLTQQTQGDSLLRIRLQTAVGDDSYAQLAEHSGVAGYGEEIIRALNRAYPKGEPQPGQVVKIIK